MRLDRSLIAVLLGGSLACSSDAAVGPSVPPVGSLTVFADSAGTIGIYALTPGAASGVMRLVVRGNYPDYAWSPDRRELAYSGVSVLTVASGAVRKVVPDTGGFVGGFSPRWSPDGSSLAYQSAGGIHVVSRTGANRRRLVPGDPASCGPAEWSLDGQRLYYSTCPRGAALELLSTVAASGSGAVGRVPMSPQVVGRAPAVSPDGRLIAFSRAAASAERGIWVMRADGTEPQQLTTSGSGVEFDVDPRWSPDGRRIAYMHHIYPIRQGTVGYGLWIMNPDGTDRQMFVPPPDVRLLGSFSW